MFVKQLRDVVACAAAYHCNINAIRSCGRQQCFCTSRRCWECQLTFICQVDRLQLPDDRHAQLHLSATHRPRPSPDHFKLQAVINAQALEQRKCDRAKHVNAGVQLVIRNPSQRDG